jgi:hypothetical protein
MKRWYIPVATLFLFTLVGTYVMYNARLEQHIYHEQEAFGRTQSHDNPDVAVDKLREIRNEETILERAKLYFQVLLGLSLALISIPVILFYLRPETSNISDKTEERLKTVQMKLDELDQKVSLTNLTEGSPDDETISKLRQHVVNAVSQLKTELHDRYNPEAQQESHLLLMRGIFQSDLERLRDQIAILRKRSNLNLAIGVSTTLVAAGLLVFMVAFANFTIHDTPTLVAYYVPRVSTVIFVEVFSFFFLRLYKSTLDEEKYYQNEITARTAREIALEAALKATDQTAMTKLTESFATVNPNKSSGLTVGSNSAPDLKNLAKLIESAAKIMSTTADKAH